MFRRRSRGHYDRGSYNSGLSTPSAAAAASASMSRSAALSSSAAAEALRRHSLDQSGADAIASFQPDYSYGQRRASSLTAAQTRAYQQQAAPPSRSYRVVYNQPQQRAMTDRSNSMTSGRTNSLSSQSGRTNSLTRTHTVVNRDINGRTLSLTTTTIRQMGSFELVSTKETPVSSPRNIRRTSSHGSLRRPQPGYGYEESIHSIDSEFGVIPEEPEALPMVQEDEDYAEEEYNYGGQRPGSRAVGRYSPPPPAKPALRAGNNHTRARAGSEVSENGSIRTGPRVSFGGAPKEFFYESYTYEDDTPAQAHPVAAAAAASRARTRPADPVSYQSISSNAAAVSAASRLGPGLSTQYQPSPQPSQPSAQLRKRTSNQSLSGRPSTVAYVSPQQHEALPPVQRQLRPVSLPQTHQQQRELSTPGLESAAVITAEHHIQRPNSQPTAVPVSLESEQLEKAGEPVSPASSELSVLSGDDHSVYSDAPDSPEEAEKLRNRGPSNRPGVPAKSALRQSSSGSADIHTSTHAYRALVQQHADELADGPGVLDDGASVASDSSFKRERRRGSRQGGSMMNSLRNKPPAPSPNNATAAGIPQLQSPRATQGFRTYSLRGQDRPDPRALLATNSTEEGTPQREKHRSFGGFASMRQPPSPKAQKAHKGSGSDSGIARFRSRIVDSDSDDDVPYHGDRNRSASTQPARSNGGGNGSGKITLRDVFSPNSDAKVLLGKRASSDNLARRAPHEKKPGVLKRLFGRMKSSK